MPTEVATASPAATDKSEVLGLLRRLGQNPGWAAYSSLVQRQLKLSAQEQANLLREAAHENASKAIYLQGVMDGLAKALSLPEQEALKLQREATPLTNV